MDFRKLRENIESQIEDIKYWIEEKSILESSNRIDKVNDKLIKLGELSENDVQDTAVSRLTDLVEYLTKLMEEILSKREAGKKGDGNIAFKCNWNDKYYKAPCSKEAYDFNINEGRAWCNSPDCKCRRYGNKATVKDHPCYESIALKEMYFGAGWDHTGESNEPRHIHHIRKGKMAILTTRPPGFEEKDRIIIACLYMKEVQDDIEHETIIYGDKDKSIEIDYDNIKVNFWDYYKNPEAEDVIFWGTGLFRYITDETVLNILKGIGEKYKNTSMNTAKIIDLIKYYEDILKKETKH